MSITTEEPRCLCGHSRGVHDRRPAFGPGPYSWAWCSACPQKISQGRGPGCLKYNGPLPEDGCPHCGDVANHPAEAPDVYPTYERAIADQPARVSRFVATGAADLREEDEPRWDPETRSYQL